MSYVNAWGFNYYLLQESKIRTPEILSEFSSAEVEVKYRLYKASDAQEVKMKILKNEMTTQEARARLRTIFGPWT